MANLTDRNRKLIERFYHEMWNRFDKSLDPGSPYSRQGRAGSGSRALISAVAIRVPFRDLRNACRFFIALISPDTPLTPMEAAC
jgi:hypothetical protein